MKKLFMLISFAACGQDAVQSSVDPLQGGASDKDHPAVGMILFANGLQCTGTLIAPDVVLTAAHCLWMGPAWSFNTGDYYSRTPHAVQKQVDNRDWNDDCTSQTLDVGLLRLIEPITNIEPIAMSDAPEVGTACTQVGFGRHTEDNGSTTIGFKRSGTVRVVEIQEGRVVVENDGSWSDKGDSGGPLLCGDKLVGTLSCGYPNGGNSLFVKTSAATDWIQRHIALLQSR